MFVCDVILDLDNGLKYIYPELEFFAEHFPSVSCRPTVVDDDRKRLSGALRNDGMTHLTARAYACDEI